MNLRELTEDQEAILAQVESGDFTLDDVSDHLDMLEGERNKKIESYLHVINNLETKHEAATKELFRLSAIVTSRKNSLDNIKSWLLMSMKDGEKHEFDLFKVSRVKGREVVNITDEAPLKAFYGRSTLVESIDKKGLLIDLKAGVEIKGAEIVIGKASLRIK